MNDTIPSLKLAFFTLPLLLLVPFAKAQLVHESFSLESGQYSVGSLGGQNSDATGFDETVNWQAPNNNSVRPVSISNMNLSYENLQTSAGTGSVFGTRTTDSTSGFLSEVYRNSTATAPAAIDNTITVWSSFLFEYDFNGAAVSNANPFRLNLQFQRSLYVGIDASGNATMQRAGAMPVDNDSIGSGKIAASGSLAQGSTHLFLIKTERDLTNNQQTSSLWLNPNLLDGEGGLGSAAISIVESDENPLLSAGDAFTLGARFQLTRDSNGAQEVWFDEFRLGTTFNAVAPIPEPSVFALGLGLIALLVTLRRR